MGALKALFFVCAGGGGGGGVVFSVIPIHRTIHESTLDSWGYSGTTHHSSGHNQLGTIAHMSNRQFGQGTRGSPFSFLMKTIGPPGPILLVLLGAQGILPVATLGTQLVRLGDHHQVGESGPTCFQAGEWPSSANAPAFLRNARVSF